MSSSSSVSSLSSASSNWGLSFQKRLGPEASYTPPKLQPGHFPSLNDQIVAPKNPHPALGILRKREREVLPETLIRRASAAFSEAQGDLKNALDKLSSLPQSEKVEQLGGSIVAAYSLGMHLQRHWEALHPACSATPSELYFFAAVVEEIAHGCLMRSGRLKLEGDGFSSEDISEINTLCDRADQASRTAIQTLNSARQLLKVSCASELRLQDPICNQRLDILITEYAAGRVAAWSADMAEAYLIQCSLVAQFGGAETEAIINRARAEKKEPYLQEKELSVLQVFQQERPLGQECMRTIYDLRKETRSAWKKFDRGHRELDKNISPWVNPEEKKIALPRFVGAIRALLLLLPKEKKEALQEQIDENHSNLFGEFFPRLALVLWLKGELPTQSLAGVSNAFIFCLDPKAKERLAPNWEIPLICQFDEDSPRIDSIRLVSYLLNEGKNPIASRFQGMNSIFNPEVVEMPIDQLLEAMLGSLPEGKKEKLLGDGKKISSLSSDAKIRVWRGIEEAYIAGESVNYELLKGLIWAEPYLRAVFSEVALSSLSDSQYLFAVGQAIVYAQLLTILQDSKKSEADRFSAALDWFASRFSQANPAFTDLVQSVLTELTNEK